MPVPDSSEPAKPGEGLFAGSAACGACHRNEMAAWRGSHHDLAMQEATDKTVLGDFNNAAFSHGGSTSRFFRRDGNEAINILEASLARHPADRDTLFELITINRDAGHIDAALSRADRLVTVNPSAKPLVDQLRQRTPSR